MEIPAIRQVQNGKELFQCFLGAEVLGNPKQVVADAYSSANREGYQREAVDSRVRAFSNYLLRRGEEYGGDQLSICPNSLVLNARDKLKFAPVQGDNMGLLELGETKLFEVDGQHRIRGFQRAVDEEPDTLVGFKFPCVIVNGLTRLDEALIFFLINTKQARVQTDLCQRIIAQNLEQTRMGEALLAQGKDWMKMGLKIIDALNNQPGQPWHGKIKTPGPASRRSSFVTQNSFLMSLRPILTTEPYRSTDVEQIIALLTRYWCAIQQTLPACFVEGEQKNYIIQKSAGVMALHQIFPTVIERARIKGTRITQDMLAGILEYMFEDREVYWAGKNDQGAAAYGSSHKGVRILVNQLTTKLPDNPAFINL